MGPVAPKAKGGSLNHALLRAVLGCLLPGLLVAGWSGLGSGTLTELSAVCFPVDEVTGYAAGGGGLLLKTTDAGGIAELAAPPAPRSSSPSLLRGVLHLPVSSFVIRHSDLLDASGRRVLSLSPGPNDVSHLAPGIYFVHSTIDIRQSSFSKVVLTR